MVEQYIDGGLYSMDDEKRDYEKQQRKDKFIHDRFEFGKSLEAKIKRQREKLTQEGSKANSDRNDQK